MNALHRVAMRQHSLTGMVQRGKNANLGGLATISAPAEAGVGRSENKNVEECDWRLGKLVNKFKGMQRLFGNCQGQGYPDYKLLDNQAN